MKPYQKILSACLALLTVFMFVFSFIDTKERVYNTKQDVDKIMEYIEKMSQKPHSIIQEESHEEVITYLINTIESFGINNEDTDLRSSYQIQKFMAVEEYEETYDLTNIIVSIPANDTEKTGDAVMFMAHFDSVAMGSGASDDLVSVSVMLETIYYYNKLVDEGLKLKNDLIFAFVDGEEFGLYGSEYFVNEFFGYNNVVERIKFAVNLESRGTSGTLIMFETSRNNYKTIELFARVNSNVFTSSIANMVYQSMPNGTDYSNLKDLYQGLNFANLGGGENYHTQNDNLNNVSKVYLTQQAIIVDSLIQNTMNYNLNKLYEANQEAIFFSYLNVITVVYSNTAAIIFAILTLLVLAWITVLNIKNKRNKIRETLRGYLVVALSVAASVIVIYALYYLYQLIAVLFNVIDIHMFGTITYSNTSIIIGIILTTIVVCAITSHSLMKLFKIDGIDVRRAISYFIAFIGIGLSFVLPVTSYVFLFTGLLLLVNELLNIVIKKVNINNYHLELFIFALSLPIFIPVIDLASSALGLNMCYALAALVALEVMYIIPTCLPALKFITIAKVLNLANKENKKKEKVMHGMVTLAIISQIFLILSTVFVAHPSMNLQGKQNFSRYPYDDALVFVAEEKTSGRYDVDYRIYDLNTYSHMKKVLPNDYIWNREEQAYTKNIGEMTLEFNTTIAKGSDILNVTRSTPTSIVYITIKNGSNIGKVQAIANGKAMEFDVKENGDTTLIFHNDFIMTFMNEEGEPINATISYLELMENYEPLKQYDDFKMLEINQYFKYNVWLKKIITY